MQEQIKLQHLFLSETVFLNYLFSGCSPSLFNQYTMHNDNINTGKCGRKMCSSVFYECLSIIKLRFTVLFHWFIWSL